MESRQEKAYERHAWILLAVVAAVGLLFVLVFLFFLAGLPSIEYEIIRTVTGRSWEEIVSGDPGIASLIRELYWELSLANAAFNVVILAIAATSFRKGERWAWYAVWTLPLFWVGIIATLGVANPFPVLLFLSVLGILLPYRKFFPSKTA